MRRFYPPIFILLWLCLAGADVLSQGFRDAAFNAGVANGQAQGYVSAIQPDGKVIIGGSYTEANGESKGYLVRVNGVNGSLDTTFNASGLGPNATVLAILVLSDGKIMIGGDFTSYNGTASNRLIRLNADGTRDTTFSGSGLSAGRVTSIVQQSDGKIVVAGQSISNYNGATAWGWFRVNTNGTRDTTFLSQFSAAPGIDQIVLQPDGKFIMVGGFTGYQSTAVMGVLRANSDGTLDTTFNTGGAGTDGWVASAALQPDGDVLIGGSFTSYNGVPTGPFIRLLSNGVVDGGFIPPSLSAATSYVESIEVQADGGIVAAGAMDFGGGVMKPVIRVNTFGSLDTGFNPGPSDNLAYDVKLTSSGDVLLTGWFTRVGSTDRPGVARIFSNGTVDPTFNFAISKQGTILSVLPQPDGKVIAVGNFQTANGVTYKDIVRFNANGSIDTSFVSGLGTAANNYRYGRAVLTAELQPDGKILVGGDFGSFNGSGRHGLVRLNANGSLDTSFDLDPTAFDYGRDVWIYDIAIAPDGKIICAGLSYAPGAGSPNVIWRLNPNGSIDSTFGRRTGNSQATGVIITSDGKYLLTGNFTLYDGISSQRIVKVNTDGSKDNAFTGAANGLIANALEQPDGKLIVYGSFPQLQGQVRVRIGRLNANGTIDLSFQSSPSGGGTDNTVRSVVRLNNGNLLVGGSFTAYSGVTANKLMVLNPNGGLISAFTSGFGAADTVHAIGKQPDGKVVVGGAFDTYSGATAKSIVRLFGPSINGSGSGRTAFDFTGDGKADVSLFRPSTRAWSWVQSNDYNIATIAPFGLPTDIPVPADYDGDGKTDIATWRDEPTDPDRAMFYIFNSSDYTFTTEQFGRTGDDPTIVGDYNGDGKADLAVYRDGANGGQSYFLYRPIGTPVGNFAIVPWGIDGDKAMKGDYNGDGRSDYAVYRPSTRVWYFLENDSYQVSYGWWGLPTDKFVPADYDGDGKTDMATYRDGIWYILKSSTGTPEYGFFGLAGDVPVPADYDGDGLTDYGVYRNGTWYILQSTAGFTAYAFGQAGDIPLNSLFVD